MSINSLSTAAVQPQYVGIQRMTRENGAFAALDLNIWGVWPRPEPAWIWIDNTTGVNPEDWKVHALQSPDRWAQVLAPWVQGQSTEELQVKLPHVIVLDAGDEQEIVGPYFFPTLFPKGWPSQEVDLQGLGRRICRGPFPLLGKKQHPVRDFCQDAVRHYELA